ncbi:MAG: 2Fe-2S iron-sulfur cluster binding domain-containing protein [Polyangiaceae bacterium]|nr:2Fe-2S iron-sulfur cluster binding domain-containing protein [Polyangiaceae bacterium]
MPSVSYRGERVELEAGESVLDALLRAGFEVPSSCRSGACQACVLRAEKGAPGAEAQVGLRPAQRERGCFMSCMARPSEDLEIAEAGLPSSKVRLLDVLDWGGEIFRVRLEVPAGFAYRGGQYVQLVRPGALIRAYSLASHPEDPWLELHVRKHPHGKMSGWLTSAGPGAELEVRGPAGECYYQAADPTQPLVLVGMGTGMSPIYAVLRDALGAGHCGPITVIQGARNTDELYLAAELDALCSARNVSLIRCALEGPAGDPRIGDAVERTLEACPSFKGCRVFLCGGATQVKALKRQAFLRGARLQEISSDPFISGAAST